MCILKSIGLVIAGAAAGVTLLLSCGGGSPGDADAAACDCPDAEPPLAGRIVTVDTRDVVDPNSDGGTGVRCPFGSQMLSGSCTKDVQGTVFDIVLRGSGFFLDGVPPSLVWACEFRNNTNGPVTVRASVLCLVPPS